MRHALTYDDVALVPQFNNIPSRTEPLLESWLTRKTKVSIPILAANMDTVIGDELAEPAFVRGEKWTAMARCVKRDDEIE